MAGLEGFDWTKFLAFPSPVNVMNDAHAALLGEVWNGAAAGFRNVFLLTLGTGVGGAIYADGQLLKGQIGRAGHLGHICLNVDKPQDAVGIPGSLESAIAEGSVVSRSEGRFSSSKALVDAVIAGDEFARTVWERSIYELACGIASLINVVDPELIVIGGGIAKAEAALYETLDKYLEKLEWRPNGHRVPIVKAKLGEWAGAMGAAYNAIQQNTTLDCSPLTSHAIEVHSTRSL
jgi:glucokinase